MSDERARIESKNKKINPAVQEIDVWKEDYLKDGPDDSKAGSLRDKAHTAERSRAERDAEFELRHRDGLRILRDLPALPEPAGEPAGEPSGLGQVS